MWWDVLPLARNEIGRSLLILAPDLLAVVAGLALGFVYDITKEPIAEQEQKAKAEAYEAVFRIFAIVYAIEQIMNIITKPVLKKPGRSEKGKDNENTMNMY